MVNSAGADAVSGVRKLCQRRKATGTSASQAASAIEPPITNHIASPRGSAGNRGETEPIVIGGSHQIDVTGSTRPDRVRPVQLGGSRRPPAQPFFADGTGSPATLTLNEPRLVRVQKYTVFQSSPPNATLAVLAKPCTMRPSFLPFGATM